MQRDRIAESLRLVERPRENHRIVDWDAVVGKESCPCFDHAREINQLDPAKTARDRRYWDQPRAMCVLGAFEHITGSRGTVVYWRRVGHRGHRRETTRGGGAQSARDRFLFRKTGVAQMYMRIDESRDYPASVHIDNRDRLGRRERSLWFPRLGLA